MAVETVEKTQNYVEIFSTTDDGVRVPMNPRTMNIHTGDEILVEVTNGSIIAGLALTNNADDWLFRKSDEVLEAERAMFVKKAKIRWGWD
jgi:hypothetical protein